MYPDIQFPLQENGSPNRFQSILNKQDWEKQPKLMGKVYRFLATQTAWQGGTSIKDLMGKECLRQMYSKLNESYQAGTLTTYQFYKCHGIIPSHLVEDIKKCQEIFNGNISQEQAEKIHKRIIPNEIREKFFPTDFKVISVSGKEYLCNRFSFLTLFNEDLRQKFKGLITQNGGIDQIRLLFSDEQMKIIMETYQGDNLVQWDIEKLIDGVLLEKKGLVGIRATQVLKDRIDQFINKSNSISIDEFINLLESTYRINDFQLQCKLLTLTEQFYSGFSFYAYSNNEKISIKVDNFPIDKLHLLMNPKVEILCIDIKTLSNYYFHKIESFPEVNVLFLTNQHSQCITNDKALNIVDLFPNLNSIAIDGPLLTQEGAVVLSDKVTNLFVKGSTHLSPYSIKVDNLIYESPVDTRPDYAVVKTAFNASNPSLDFSNFPTLPYEFFRLLLTNSNHNYLSLDFSGSIHLSSDLLTATPSYKTIHTLNISNCPRILPQNLLSLKHYKELKWLNLDEMTFPEELFETVFPKLKGLTIDKAKMEAASKKFTYPACNNLLAVKIDARLPKNCLNTLAINSKENSVIFSNAAALNSTQIKLLLSNKKYLCFDNLLPNEEPSAKFEKPFLKTLWLQNTRNPHRFIYHAPNLETLNLHSCIQIDERELKWQKLEKSLKHLSLNNSQGITDLTIIGIAHHLQKLESLSLENITNFLPTNLENVLKYCEKVKTVKLRGCTQFDTILQMKLALEYPKVNFIFNCENTPSTEDNFTTEELTPMQEVISNETQRPLPLSPNQNTSLHELMNSELAEESDILNGFIPMLTDD